MINKMFSTIPVFLLVLAGINSQMLAYANGEPVYHISIIKLIIDPDKFKNKMVSVSGYLTRESGPYLYLSRDHASVSDISSGIPVSKEGLSKSDCMDQFVRLSGKVVLDSSQEFWLVDVMSIEVPRASDGILVSCL